MARMPALDGLSVRSLSTDVELVCARRMHACAYLEQGYVTPDEVSADGVIDDPWVPFSDFFGGFVEETGEMVGTCRMIRGSVAGFPAFAQRGLHADSLDFFADIDPSDCMEISSLATTRGGIQNTAISAALYALVWHEAIERRVPYVLAMTDDRLLRLLRRWFHVPFEEIGVSRHYMGSDSTPVAMYLPRMIDDVVLNLTTALAHYSPNLSFAELNDVSIDLRNRTPEHRPVDGSNDLAPRAEQPILL